MKKLLFILTALIVTLTISAQLKDSPVLNISDCPTQKFMTKRGDSSLALIQNGESSPNKSPRRKAALAEGQYIIGNYTSDYVATGEWNGIGPQDYEGAISIATIINTSASKGDKISAIRVGLALPATLKRVFIYPVLDNGNIQMIGEGAYEQSLTLDGQESWNVIDLTEPFTIETNQLFIGFEYEQVAGIYPLSFWKEGETVESYIYLDAGDGPSWYIMGAVEQNLGNLCIQAIANYPEIPTKLTVSNITMESAMLSWWGGSATYDVQYREAGANNEAEWQTVSTDGLSYTLTDLNRNTEYEWQVRKSDGEWSEISTFTTLNAPVAPEIVTIDHIGYDNVTVNWLTIENISYNLRYATEPTSGEEPNWTVVENVTSPYTIENLTAETNYILQLQSVDEIAAGEWGNSNSFATKSLSTPPDGLTATPINVMAKVSWEGIQHNYEVQYRRFPVLYEDFQDAYHFATTWRTYDKDGDDNNWNVGGFGDGKMYAVSYSPLFP